MTKRDDQATDYAFERLVEAAGEWSQDRKRCATCGWFGASGDGTGECHRYPPAPARMSGAVGEHAVTSEDNVCGEYRNKKTGLGFLKTEAEVVRPWVAAFGDRLDRLERRHES